MTIALRKAPVADQALMNGLPAGTIVMTLDGEMPVEHLTAGDRVISRTQGMAVLASVDVVDVVGPTVRILAGSLGHTRPGRDMRLGADTLVHIRDWRAKAMFGKGAAMVPAHRLVDGEFVTAEAAAPQRLYVLTFDRPQIIYADGLEVGC